MSDLQDFKEIIMKDKESIGDSPYLETIKKLTKDKEYQNLLSKYADITIKLIDKDINFKDYTIAMAMIHSIVDVMLEWLMKNNNLQFMSKK